MTNDCLVCGSEQLRDVEIPNSFIAVTSDCRPLELNPEAALCGVCGHVQKRTDESWRRETQRIYDRYAVYEVSSGAEQKVFSGAGAKPRSVALLEGVARTVNIPQRGRMLDFGCGNGAMLASFGALYHDWTMVGVDLDPRLKESVEAIPGVERYVHQGLDAVTGRFDMITMMHSIEHMPDPKGILNILRERLTDSGSIMVQVPDLRQNPFDLMVFDHCSHFVPETLGFCASTSGFRVVLNDAGLVRKEITLIATPGTTDEPDLPTKFSEHMESLARYHVEWLNVAVIQARDLANETTFGIWGTASAAGWLAGMLGSQVEFFVDEDESRIGGTFLDRPVIKPQEVPDRASVYLAFPRFQAENLYDRLSARFDRFRLHLPPEWSLRTTSP